MIGMQEQWGRTKRVVFDADEANIETRVHNALDDAGLHKNKRWYQTKNDIMPPYRAQTSRRVHNNRGPTFEVEFKTRPWIEEGKKETGNKINRQKITVYSVSEKEYKRFVSDFEQAVKSG